MSVEQRAVFVGANKQSNALDYNPALKLAAFGATNTVAIWRPLESHGIETTLKAHTKEVTGVKFIPGTEGTLVSCAEDGLVVVWELDSNSNYTKLQTIEFHSGSVTAIATAPGIIATGGVDGKVALWEKGAETSKWTLTKFIEVRPSFFYPTCLALQEVYGEYVIAIGGTSNDVYIYNTAKDNDGFVALKGHEDWMKTLAWTKDDQGWILASGSQDRYIRLWRVRLETQEDSTQLILLANKKEKLQLASSRQIVEVLFEALIMGHDDWVTGLVWNNASTLQLLSSSADTGLMIWEMDSISGIWVSVSRLGEMSIKGASTATGSSGGFWSCLWIHDENNKKEYILANGKTGAFRKYEKQEHSWNSVLGITGPNKEVTDLVWSKTGEYFFATSLDQTTRMYAESSEEARGEWKELARPQIHGYDMICIDNINDTKFVSGGDEKVLRVFEMTKDTADLLTYNGATVTNIELLPVTASLPVLGLSNKADNDAPKEGIVGEQGATEEDAETEEGVETEKEETAKSLTLPLEDQLQRTTLFPEIEKLYGHGYELTCCATTEGFIASACRSNSARHALIRVFDTKEYQMVHVLEGHNLTITSMEFSPDGKYLAAVSRDRQVSLWNVDEGFKLVEINQAHSRIVWDITWLGNSHFITGSRDKLIKLFSVSETGFQLVQTVKFALPVSSVSSYRDTTKYYIGVGMDEGIQIYTSEKQELKEFCQFDASITPDGRVTKLGWGKKVDGRLRLAVGSSDASIRVYEVQTAN